MNIINHDTVKDGFNVPILCLRASEYNVVIWHSLSKKENYVQIELSQIFVFFQKNATDDGVYTIFTGETDITKLGHIDQYNGSR